MPDLDLWAAAADALGSALVNGLWGIVLTPLVSMLAAWLAARRTVGAKHAAPVREEMISWRWVN